MFAFSSIITTKLFSWHKNYTLKKSIVNYSDHLTQLLKEVIHSRSASNNEQKFRKMRTGSSQIQTEVNSIYREGMM